MKTARRVLRFGLLAAILAFWTVVLRPQALGGPTLYIVVRGSSMLPTYQTGDLVVVESAAAYTVGDIVAYRVPGGEIGEGHVVVHRIAGGDPTEGFIVEGDNNNSPDPWTPRLADIAGKAWLMVPGLGRLIAYVHQPIIAAGLAAAVMVSLMLARPSPARSDGRTDRWRTRLPRRSAGV